MQAAQVFRLSSENSTCSPGKIIPKQTAKFLSVLVGVKGEISWVKPIPDIS